MIVLQARNLKPKDKPYKVSDFDSLYIAVKPNGSKLWHLKYRLDGKEKVFSIGVYPVISLKQARLAHDEARSKVAEGFDPSEIKQEEKRDPDKRCLIIQKKENELDPDTHWRR